MQRRRRSEDQKIRRSEDQKIRRSEEEEEEEEEEENQKRRRKSETREGCGSFLGSLPGFLRNIPERENAGELFPNRRLLEHSRRVGHRKRQTCREALVDTALNLDPTFCEGCFLKSTVPAFLSSSEKTTRRHEGPCQVLCLRLGVLPGGREAV